MAYVESHQAVRDHWKTKKLARLLGIHKMHAVGLLHGLWWWALDCSRNGSLGHVEAIDIAAGCDWDGNEHEFVDALVQCQWLDRSEDDLMIHDWDQYGGKLTAKRESDARRKREERQKNAVHRTSTGHPPDGAGRQDKTIQDKTRDSPLNPPRGKAATEYTPDFDSFWVKSNKKGGKSDAQRAWDQLSEEQRKLADAAIANWVGRYRDIGWAYDVSRWLNGHMWESALPEPKNGKYIHQRDNLPDQDAEMGFSDPNGPWKGRVVRA